MEESDSKELADDIILEFEANVMPIAKEYYMNHYTLGDVLGLTTVTDRKAISMLAKTKQSEKPIKEKSGKGWKITIPDYDKNILDQSLLYSRDSNSNSEYTDLGGRMTSVEYGGKSKDVSLNAILLKSIAKWAKDNNLKVKVSG